MRHALPASSSLVLRLSAAVAALVLVGAPSVQAQEAPAPAEPIRIDPPLPASPILPASPASPTLPAAGEEAAPPRAPEVWASVPHDGMGRSAYGLYLAGRLAMGRGEQATAADYLTAAQALAPEQAGLRQQAFVSAMFGGDLSAAVLAAPDAPGAPAVLTQAARLIDAVVLFADGDARAALAVFEERPIGAPHNRAGLYLRPFIAAAAGETPVFEAPRAGRDRSDLFARRHHAVIMEARGRPAEAEAQYRLLMDDPAGAVVFRLAYGEFLERRGRRAEAAALYDAALAENPRDAAAAAARERVARRGRPPAALTLAQGAAQALSIAAMQASLDGADEFGALYLRLALRLDPSDEYRLMLGQALAEARMEPAARAALAEVGGADPALYAAARASMALSHEREGRTEDALAEMRRAYAVRPEDTAIAYLTAAFLSQLGHYDEALEILNGPVLNTADQSFDTRFLRGATYESRGDVVEAEAELWAALELKPDDPLALNYLGYLWVDSGRRVHQGAEMIERAFALEPDNGNIQDSLGWAQYRQGQYEAALVNLEGAVEKLPANAEINDHLGDAYWQVGRRREARFQWTRVLSLDTDDARRAEAERKLAEGLEPAVPVSAAEAAPAPVG